jgi:formate dehydrogenase subunit gamma
MMTTTTTKMLPRYNDKERMNHWVMALCVIASALSGFAFFHPGLFFLSNLFGGGTWARILHPFFGLLGIISFAGMFFRLRGENTITAADKEWKAHMGDLMRGNKSAMPPVGKYNYGQKMVFWVMAGSAFTLLVTGFTFWAPWFTAYFPIGLQRVAVLLHAVAAFSLVMLIIAHVYAAIWVKGTIRAMTRGTVSEDWAKINHPLWYKEVTEKP